MPPNPDTRIKPVRAFALIFACLLALAAVLAVGLTLPEPPAGRGALHAVHRSMLEGGNADRHAGRLWIAWAYGGLQIALFVACLWAGVRRDARRRWLLVAAGAINLAVLGFLLLAYADGATGANFYFGFPLPTALLLFGIWPAGFLFVALYVALFRSWVYGPDEARRFAALKSKFQRQEEEKRG